MTWGFYYVSFKFLIIVKMSGARLQVLDNVLMSCWNVLESLASYILEIVICGWNIEVNLLKNCISGIIVK
jgi:hypothetical protein